MVTRVHVVNVAERRVNLAKEFIGEVVEPVIKKASAAGKSEISINTECIGVVSEIIQMILNAGYRVECGGNNHAILVYWDNHRVAAITS